MSIDITLQQIPAGFVGYKGTNGVDWRDTGGNDKEWSGCYITGSTGRAKGYIELEKGVASVFRCEATDELKVIRVTGSAIANPNVSGDDKAKLIKQELQARLSIQLGADDKLIPTLGELGYVYMGPDTEDHDELIVPWKLVPQFIAATRYREYERKDFESKRWRADGSVPWQAMDTEPTNDPVATLAVVLAAHH